MPVPPGFRTRLLLSQGAVSKLGRLALAGTVQRSLGVSANPMRVLGAYAVVYLLEGQGEFSDARGFRRRVETGDLMWIFPDIPHAYGPAAGERWEEVYLVFDGPIFELWRKRRLLDPDEPIWWLRDTLFWYERIAAVARPTPGTDGAFLQVVQLQALLAEMRVAAQAGEDHWLKRACRLLDREEVPDLPAIARAAGMSYDTFRRRFSQQIGSAPAAYRQARRIERACALLMRPGTTNKEIAEQLGFSDEFHFAKMFKKRMGFSPFAFRRKTLGFASR
jgi:AraC-like DNA-binding protein